MHRVVTVSGMGPPEGLISAVAATVAAADEAWFPEFGGRVPEVRPAGGETRSRCFLYRFELASGPLTRTVVVKVRHSDPSLRRLDRWEDRPILAPVRTMSDEATAQCEYAGLQLIADAVRGDGSARFGVLRPLAYLPGHAALVTDFVAQPTLRSVLLGTSRLRVGRRGRPDLRPWHNAGAWLRAFHDHPTSLVLPPRAGTTPAVGELYQQFGSFLTDRIGPQPLLRRLVCAGHEIAAQALPPELPLATGHGDFVAANMFTTAEGRITAFDPLPLWRTPVYQDIATLLVGLKSLPVQAVTRGLALPRSDVAGYEAAFLHGYFGDRPVPHSAVRAFQLLVLLDKWSALVSRHVREGVVRPQLRQARIRIVSRYYHEEARRLLGPLDRLPATDSRAAEA